jgi:hypothetical protein
MVGSYEKINYSLRPAKSIERKMLCDAFRRLSAFDKVENYQYIGFGSTYFSDFILFHRALGITKMISIEKDKENKERFMFNRPFRCVELEFGKSNEVLPKLNWDAKSILWLDYDDKLDNHVLSDVRFFCINASPGSVIVLSVNAHPIRRPDNINVDELPIKEGELPTLSAVPKEDIEKYARMYRYFPTFTEADI